MYSIPGSLYVVRVGLPPPLYCSCTAVGCVCSKVHGCIRPLGEVQGSTRPLGEVHDLHGVSVDRDGPGHSGRSPVLGAQAGTVGALPGVVLLLHQVVAGPVVQRV